VVSLLRGRKSKDNEDEDETTSPKNSNKEAV
jgi:hypothetical protein